MEIDFAPDTANPGTQRPIDDHRVCPGFGIMIAHVTPTAVVVKRASDAGGLRGRRIFMSAQPGEAIAPALRCSINGQRFICQSSNEGFIRVASSVEIPIHCSATA